MTPSRTLLAIAAVLASATLATAQTAPATGNAEVAPTQAQYHGGRQARGGMRMLGAAMSRIDADNSGSITQDEIDTFRGALVAGADASGDGAITLDEFTAIYLELSRDRMVDRFQDLDADGDGTITGAEMDARFGGIVDRMDRNGDGELSRADRPHRSKGNRPHRDRG